MPSATPGLLVAGRLVVDEVLHCPRPPLPGTAQRAASREVVGGGQVWHTALAAVAHVPVTVTGWCGDDPDSALLRARLARSGVRDALVAVPDSSRAVVLVGPDGERTIVSRPRPDSPVGSAPDPAVLSGQGWLHLDGYALDATGGDAVVALARAAADTGLPVSLEPPAAERIPGRADLLRRLPRLELLLGRPDEVAAGLAALAEEPRCVVTHDRDRDVTARCGTQRWTVPVPPGPVAALGAGDRFAGGVVAACLRGAGLEAALAAGVAAARSAG